MSQPNLTERMEEIVIALENAHDALSNDDKGTAWTNVEHAFGVAGEVLTMIDGR